jgi:hypothetical protein
MTPSLEQATDARIMEIRDILRSGAGELAGKSKREYGPRFYDAGTIIGRFRGYSHAYPELATIDTPRTALLTAIDRKQGKVYERLVKAVQAQMIYAGYVPRRKSKRGHLGVEAHQGNKKCKLCGVPHTKGEHRFHGPGAFHRTHLFSFPQMNPPRRQSNVYTFHGRFRSKILAARRERSIPGSFIHAHNGFFYVMKPARKANPGPETSQAVVVYPRVLSIEAQKLGYHANCDAECKRCGHKYIHDFRPGAVMYGLSNGDLLIRKG